MRRACKLSFKFLTNRKRRRLEALLQSYRSAVNFFIESLWDNAGGLNKGTLARLPDKSTRLSARYKSQALKQALDIVISTKRSCKAAGKPATLPVFRGDAVLDAKFISISLDDPTVSFDLFLKISSLTKGKRITIPTKRTSVLNKWLGKSGATLIQGCSLSENRLVVWVEVDEPPPRESGLSLGIDLGMNKLLALSDGSFIGEDFKMIRDKVVRSSPRSLAKKRAMSARDNYIQRMVNSLPWDDLKVVAVEDLKNLKKGKSPKRGRAFRRAAAPWTYRRVLRAITNRAQENGVLLVFVSPRHTSQKCPSCGTVDRRSRQAECFECVNCGHSQHADTVGAINILNKARRLVGSVESPATMKPND